MAFLFHLPLGSCRASSAVTALETAGSSNPRPAAVRPVILIRGGPTCPADSAPNRRFPAVGTGIESPRSIFVLDGAESLLITQHYGSRLTGK